MATWETEGKSDEYYTPQYVFDALGCRFNLDVAGTPSKYQCVPADFRYYVGGLEKDWFDFVWMNPPFGRRNGVAPWLDKFFAHGNGIALTPDRTSAQWFRDAWERADLVMFTPKISFIRPDGSTAKQPGCGTALWAKGEAAQHALLLAQKAGLGIIAKPLISLPLEDAIAVD